MKFLYILIAYKKYLSVIGVAKVEKLFVVVGLGNPERKYEGTRHNIGFETVEALARKNGISISKSKHKALIGEGIIKGNKVVLVKPQTYMNLSGESIREIVDWYKIDKSNLILVYDDIDLNPGELKIRPKGSAGTHNGMRSTIYHLQADNFPRVRVGIGKPNGTIDLADYVLGKFKNDELDIIGEAISNAVVAIEAIMVEGIDFSMNRFNSQK